MTDGFHLCRYYSKAQFKVVNDWHFYYKNTGYVQLYSYNLRLFMFRDMISQDVVNTLVLHADLSKSCDILGPQAFRYASMITFIMNLGFMIIFVVSFASLSMNSKLYQRIVSFSCFTTICS